MKNTSLISVASNMRDATFKHLLNRRVAIIETWNHTPHLETGLEIALRYASRNIHVDYHHIGGSLEYVLAYIRDDLKLNRAIKLIKRNEKSKYIAFHIKPRKIRCDTKSLELINRQLSSTQDVADLKRLEYKNHPYGRYLYSTLVEVTQESSPSIQANMSLIIKMAHSWLQAFLYTTKVCNKSGICRIIVFNGRFNCVGGIREACLEKKIPISYHERGGSLDRYSLYKFRPHDQIPRQRHMLKRWKIANIQNPNKAFQLGTSFYIRRLGGDGLSWFSFNVKDTTPIELWLSKHKLQTNHYVVYFQSSDDEFAGIEDCRPEVGFSDQLRGVHDLASVLRDLGIRLCIRMHPNMKGKSADFQIWNNVSQKLGLVLVDPEDSVDSYELARHAAAVVVYHSTIGAESLFLCKPVLCLGPSFYNQIITAIPIASNKLEIENFFSNDSQVSKEEAHQQVVAYGYSSLTYGTPFRYVKVTGIFSAEFLGSNLSSSVQSSFARRSIQAFSSRAKHLINYARLISRC